jgi:hypothetical protein
MRIPTGYDFLELSMNRLVGGRHPIAGAASGEEAHRLGELTSSVIGGHKFFKLDNPT